VLYSLFSISSIIYICHSNSMDARASTKEHDIIVLSLVSVFPRYVCYILSSHRNSPTESLSLTNTTLSRCYSSSPARPVQQSKAKRSDLRPMRVCNPIENSLRRSDFFAAGRTADRETKHLPTLIASKRYPQPPTHTVQPSSHIIRIVYLISSEHALQSLELWYHLPRFVHDSILVLLSRAL